MPLRILAASKTLWSGITLAGIGSVIATVTGEGLAGTLVAFGGVVVVGYGLWAAAREKVVKDALKRERVAHDRLNDALTRLEDCHSSLIKAKARLASEKHHEPP